MTLHVDERCKILLIDDNADKLLALEAVLSELGQHIVKAASGSEALRLLLQDDYAVILLDVRMPIMDGFETAAMIRQRRRCAQTPIIFVTANDAAENHVSRGYSLGAVDYIFSPVVPDALRSKVSVFIDLHRKAEQQRHHSDQLRLAAIDRAEGVEQRLQELLNRLNVGVFRSDHQGKVIEANPAFLRLLGVPSTDAIAHLDLHSLQLHRVHTDAYPLLKFGVAPPLDGDVELSRADGVRIWVALSKVRAPLPQDRHCIDGTIEDISARKLAELALADKVQELGRSNRDLAQFAGVASHDLQEPLRMIGAYLDLLRLRHADRLDEKALTYLDHAIQSSNRMRELIKALLTYSEIDQTEPVVCAVDAGEVVREVLGALQPAIGKAAAIVTCGQFPTILIDRGQLHQLFLNLIGNALKFHGASPPRVHITTERRGRKWHFTVSDNGIGIDPIYHDRIFELFRRLHSVTDYPGTGIGLASCKRIVERFGGRIWIDSEFGKNTTIHFSLPAPPETVERRGIDLADEPTTLLGGV